MKYRLILFGLLLGCIALLTPIDAQVPKAGKEKDKKEPEKTDITAQVREMNSDKFASPPTEFRAGHVNPKKLDPKAIQKKDGGFTIQLPSKAPIPTPTVYKGKLYVSGGFSTKEYYCFDAVTGKFEWGMNLDDDGPTSAVCGDDIAVFNTESCTIFALDAKTGKNLWSYFLGDPLTSTPTIAGGRVFTSYPANGGGGGALNQLQLPNNVAPPQQNDLKKLPKKKGQKLPAEFLPVIPPEQEVAKEPAQQSPKSAVQGKDGQKPAQEKGKKRPDTSHVMICLDLKTGKILWQKWIDSDVMSAPVAVDDEIYATTFSGTVYKFKQKDGTIVSAYRSRATSAPVVVGNSIYWTQRADRDKNDKISEEIAGIDRLREVQNFATAKRDAVYLDDRTQKMSELGLKSKDLDAGNGFGAGAPPTANPQAALMNIGQGNVSSMQAFQGSRILNYNNANYNCMGDELCNTDPKDGSIRWKVKLKGDLAKQGGHLAAPPAAAGGQLFLTTLQGEILLVDPDKGKVTKTYDVRSPIRSQAAIEGGRIYVGTQDGRLVCIDTGNPRFTGWYTWGANMAHTNIVEPAKK
jgi:outer membrane protein assembly factor BamB